MSGNKPLEVQAEAFEAYALRYLEENHPKVAQEVMVLLSTCTDLFQYPAGEILPSCKLEEIIQDEVQWHRDFIESL